MSHSDGETYGYHYGWGGGNGKGGARWARHPAAADDWGGGNGMGMAPLTPPQAQQLQQIPAVASRMQQLQNTVERQAKQITETQQLLTETQLQLREREELVRQLQADNARLEGVVDHADEKMRETFRIIEATSVKNDNAGIRRLIAEGLEEYLGGENGNAALHRLIQEGLEYI